MNFIQAARGGRFGHDLPQALIKGAIEEQIGAAPDTSLVV